MRKWRSHKVIEAEPITAIRRGPGPVKPSLELADGLVIEIDDPGERVRFFGEHSKLTVGDYVVRYADGYLSWSPKKAFEEGYTLCHVTYAR